jgi:hypothetical protein
LYSVLPLLQATTESDSAKTTYRTKEVPERSMGIGIGF